MRPRRLASPTRLLQRRDVDDSVTGGAPVLHLHETKAARDEHAQTTADQQGEDAVRRLRSGFETCPIARGDHDPSDDEQDADHETITVDGMAASEWFTPLLDARMIRTCQSCPVRLATRCVRHSHSTPVCPGIWTAR